jgi:hypothetical protein
LFHNLSTFSKPQPLAGFCRVSLTKKIFVVLALFLLVFVLGLYYTLRTKVTQVSDKQPFAEFMNRPLALKRPAAISKTREPDVQANPYLLTEVKDEPIEGAGPRYILPAGSTIILQHAKLFRGGTSGFETAYVLGSVYVVELKKEVAFEYAWGKNNWSLNSEVKDYYTFPLALWQDRMIEGRFNY